jgi:hypothetical protein
VNRDELLPSSARQWEFFFTTDSTDVTDFIFDNQLYPKNPWLFFSSRAKRNELLPSSARQRGSVVIFFFFRLSKSQAKKNLQGPKKTLQV